MKEKNKMRVKILILGLACLFFAYCATAPAPRTITSAFPIEASFDDVWAGVIDSFAEMNLPIANMEKDSGLITTDWITYPLGKAGKVYCDCGGLGLNVEISREGRFNVFLRKIDGNSCELKVNCLFSQRIQPVMAEGATGITRRNCVSTGKLEADMFEMVKSKLEI